MNRHCRGAGRRVIRQRHPEARPVRYNADMVLELAVTGAPPRALLLIIAVAGLGLVGLVTVIMLLAAWRRFNARQMTGPTQAAAARTELDLWQIAGQRLKSDDMPPEMNPDVNPELKPELDPKLYPELNPDLDLDTDADDLPDQRPDSDEDESDDEDDEDQRDGRN